MSRGLITALVAAVVILAVGVAGIAGYVFFVLPQGGVAVTTTAAPAPGGPAAEVVYYEMDEFVTNLGDTDRLRYIDFTVTLGLSSEGSEQIITDAEPQVRDAVLDRVRELTARDLSGAGGKARLAEEVKAGLDALLPGHVTQVYVTDMVVQ